MNPTPRTILEPARLSQRVARPYAASWWKWGALLGVVAIIIVLAFALGSPVPLVDLWSSDATRAEIARRIFWRNDGEWGLRPLRLCAGFLVGAALASSGAALQSVFRNPLAEPYLLGISSGGALGATIGLALQNRMATVLDLTWVLAFVGALGASAVIYILGQGTSRRSRGAGVSRGVLLLTGVALSAFLSAIMSLILALSDIANLASQVVFWMMGSLTRAGTNEIAVLTVTLALGLAVLLASTRDLNALRTGDEEAASLGVNVRALHLRLLVAAALMSAVAVASVGIIGFVGLIAPHIMRSLFGNNARQLVPTAALAGGALLVGCDAVARSAVAQHDLPVGIFTSLLGVPLFLFLARRMSV